MKSPVNFGLDPSEPVASHLLSILLMNVVDSSPFTSQRTEKYAAWAARLEQNLEMIARQRSIAFRLVPIILAVSLLGFFFGAWAGVGSLLTAVWISSCCIYLPVVRTHEIRMELERTRQEVSKLRERDSRP